jgi:hypothetical protein
MHDLSRLTFSDSGSFNRTGTIAVSFPMTVGSSA